MAAKIRLANHDYDGMTQQERRALVEMVFSGKTRDGKRMGVYIEWNKEGWRFDIRGHLIDEEGLRPLSDRQKVVWFGDFAKDGGGGKQKELVTKCASHCRAESLP